jgi:predicted aspartyl protease
LSDIIGHVDARNRPLVLLSILGEEDAFPVIVDSGFNGELLLHDDAIIRHRCELTGLNEPIELADKASRLLMVARAQIIWFGQSRGVDVLIGTTQSSRAATADEPIGLLGTRLLSPHKLTVDFASRRVVVSESKE